MWLLCSSHLFFIEQMFVANLCIARAHITIPEEEIWMYFGWPLSVHRKKRRGGKGGKGEEWNLSVYFLFLSCLCIRTDDGCLYGEWTIDFWSEKEKASNHHRSIEAIQIEDDMSKCTFDRFCWSSLKSQCLHFVQSWNSTVRC